MRNTFILTVLFVTLAFAVLVAATSADAQMKGKKGSPNIQGTYQLMSRTLPDGTTLRPPDVMGMITFTKDYRNFNVVWKDTAGKFFSYSVVSQYKLSPSEYSETIIFSIMNDQIGGQQIQYNMGGETRTAPVTIRDGRIAFQFPFDPPSAVFEGKKITATAEGRFVDHWEKVQ